jgi:hypothetical protein
MAAKKKQTPAERRAQNKKSTPARERAAEKRAEEKAARRRVKRAEFDVAGAVERERQRDQAQVDLDRRLESGRRPGRPSDYTPELGLRICERIASSTISIARLCEEDWMPAYITIAKWRRDVPEFDSSFTRARHDRADLYAEETKDIADTPVIGEKTKISQFGVEVTRGDMIEHRKLQVQTRQWLASKINKNVYGNAVEVTGAGGGLVTPNSPDEMSDAQLAAIAKAGQPTSEPEE